MPKPLRTRLDDRDDETVMNVRGEALLVILSVQQFHATQA
jgi:hypothetical protein